MRNLQLITNNHDDHPSAYTGTPKTVPSKHHRIKASISAGDLTVTAGRIVDYIYDKHNIVADNRAQQILDMSEITGLLFEMIDPQQAS